MKARGRSAMILAAGPGARLSPITRSLPKPLLPVANKPMMEHVVDLLARYGVQNIVLNLHYLPHLIESYFGDGTRWGVHLTYSLERELLGTAGAVARMGRILAAKGVLEGPLVVAMADALADLDLEEVLAHHAQKNAAVTVVVQALRAPDLAELAAIEKIRPFGAVQVDENDRVIGVQEKSALDVAEVEGKAPSSLACIGYYILEPDVLASIPSAPSCEFQRDWLPELLAAGVPVYAYEACDLWSDVDTFADYLLLNQRILRGENKRLLIPARQVEEGIWLGHNVALDRRAILRPPLLIGDGCRIGAGAVIGPESVLGSEVIVEPGAAIARSIVLDHTYVGRAVNVEKSIVRGNCLVDVVTGQSVLVSDPFLLGEANPALLGRGVTRTRDLLLASVALALSSPLWLAVALLNRATSPGPLLEREWRVVEDGAMADEEGARRVRKVALYRFRADPETRWGQQLHASLLDRLPRLLNVLTGELSLVGNRPLLPEEAASVQEEWQELRYRSRSGFTGLWFVEEIEDALLEERLAIDSYYAATRNWQGDLRILLRTAPVWWRRVRKRGQERARTKDA